MGSDERTVVRACFKNRLCNKGTALQAAEKLKWREVLYQATALQAAEKLRWRVVLYQGTSLLVP
jgi:hypothetical protein